MKLPFWKQDGDFFLPLKKLQNNRKLLNLVHLHVLGKNLLLNRTALYRFKALKSK